MSQYKDPYKPISIMQCHCRVLNVAQLIHRSSIWTIKNIEVDMAPKSGEMTFPFQTFREVC